MRGDAPARPAKFDCVQTQRQVFYHRIEANGLPDYA